MWTGVSKEVRVCVGIKSERRVVIPWAESRGPPALMLFRLWSFPLRIEGFLFGGEVNLFVEIEIVSFGLLELLRTLLEIFILRASLLLLSLLSTNVRWGMLLLFAITSLARFSLVIMSVGSHDSGPMAFWS